MITRSMLEAETTEQENAIESDGRSGLDFFDVLFVLADARKRIALYVVIAMILGATIAILTKPSYTASALILPPQESQSTLSSVMGQLSAVASLAGATSQLKTPADMYVGILESRTIA